MNETTNRKLIGEWEICNVRLAILQGPRGLNKLLLLKELVLVEMLQKYNISIERKAIWPPFFWVIVGPMCYRRVSKRGNLSDFSRLSPACTRAICRGYRADGPGDEVGWNKMATGVERKQTKEQCHGWACVPIRITLEFSSFARG